MGFWFQLLGWVLGWCDKVRVFPQRIAKNTWHEFSRCQHLEVRLFRDVSCLHLAYPRCASCQILLWLLRSSVCDIKGRLPCGQIMWHISKLGKFLKSFFFNFAFAILRIAIILEYTLYTLVHRQCKPSSLSALWLTQTFSVISTLYASLLVL